MRSLMSRILRIVFAAVLLVSTAGCFWKQSPPPPQIVKPPARVALVLGAGASRGFAHIGVLKILESNRVPIHMIVGTSAGSLVGSLYAYGFNAFQLQSLSFPVEKGDIVDLTVPDNGFIKGEKLEAFINRMLKDTPIEKLRTPFYAVATDIQTGEETVFASGNTGMAVRASCSVPGIFQPVRIGSRIYVDGGIVSPVPVDYARKKGADLVIAVDISMGVESPPPKTIMETIMQSVVIMYSRIAQNQLGRADIVIRPGVSHIGPTDFTRRHEAVLEGEKAALEAMPQVKAALDRLRAEGRL
jgi:NTE family protein